MFFNVSYNKKEINDQIRELVGPSFPLMKRLRLRGIGSQRFLVLEANAEVMSILEKTTNLKFCNVELRQTGIVVWFRVKLHNYILALAYNSLSISNSTEFLSIISGKWHLKLSPAHNAKLNTNFIEKMLRLQNEVTG